MNVLITGGAGFIGCNVANYYLSQGEKIIIFDNFSRDGTSSNLAWLQSNYKKNLSIIEGDIRIDDENLQKAVGEADVIFHFASQTAVTTSVLRPKEDFEINALGTLNILEAIRKSNKKPSIFYSSTNKVYGGMEDIEIVERSGRYQYKNFPNGLSEERSLDFHSPYGCSKGAADQYVRDYARIYGLRTVVFRQSCIFGAQQFGVEDQGWIAHFVISAISGKPIKIYGDGKQVRDVLYIDDLVNAFDLALKNIGMTSGEIYNIGGGPNNQLSLLELIDILEDLLGKKIKYSFHDWRPGDQRVYVSDISKAKRDFGWEPQISVREGVEKLSKWVFSIVDLNGTANTREHSRIKN